MSWLIKFIYYAIFYIFFIYSEQISRVVATFGSSRHVPIHKFDNFFNKSMLHLSTGIRM